MKPQELLAIFVPSMSGGGAQRATLNLARGVAERGYDVDLVLARAQGPLLREVPDSVRIVDLRASRAVGSLPALVRYLRRARPRAMLSVLNYANIVALWARCLAGDGVRLVVSERNTLSSAARHTSDPSGRLMPLLVRRFYPWADGIVAVSKGVADDLARVMVKPREHICVIYNPIVTPQLHEKASAPLDHPWFGPGEPPVLLAVGRLAPQKDFPTLIRAFARAQKTRRMRLVILGEGRERQALEMLIRELGLEQDVDMPGFVGNPYPYMARAAVFVLSSKWEGLPGTLIEALYCGAPVVATDCPSGPREILADGEHGELVPVGDEVALAEAMETTLAQDGPRPSRESWLPFRLEAAVSQYIDLLLGSP